MSRVLVVEDEQAIAELIALNLRHAGFDVTVAPDAERAQEAIDKVLPDLVLLDWMLPGQSGLALAKRWRAAQRTRDLPIIMLTARAEEVDKVAGLDAGASEKVIALLRRYELPLRLPASITTADVMAKLSRDKKFMAGAVRFVVLRALGDAVVSRDVTMARMDRLFGVTMAEQGVSQLVSVDLKRAEALVA